jgi:hypothetical protein
VAASDVQSSISWFYERTPIENYRRVIHSDEIHVNQRREKLLNVLTNLLAPILRHAEENMMVNTVYFIGQLFFYGRPYRKVHQRNSARCTTLALVLYATRGA